MNVKLISYSQPVEGLEDLKDIQEVVAYCARVSNPDNQVNSETSEKLLKYKLKINILFYKI